MKNFEIPYNFCKEALVGIAYKYKGEIDCVYLPAFHEHSQSTRVETHNFPLELNEYLSHIHFIKDELGLEPSVLLQKGKVDDGVIKLYLDNGVKYFIVQDDDLAIRIKKLDPTTRITASIVKQLSVEDLNTKDLSMYDNIVLDFHLNDLEIIKSLPKTHKYILMPNTPCFMDCPNTRCMFHWFNGEEFQKQGREHNIWCKDIYHKPAWIDPPMLKKYDDYVDGYKLQGREIVDYSLLFYTMHYMDDYYKSFEGSYPWLRFFDFEEENEG